MKSIAHIRGMDGEIQTVEDHLREVKRLAESFGEKLSVKHISGLAGMLHDMGKFTDAFRAYIWEAATNPDAPPKRGSVDHSTAGGKLLYDLFHTGEPSLYPFLLAEIVGNAVISHHAYLQDYLNPRLESDYLRRVREKDLPEFDQSKRLFFHHVMNESDFRDYVSRALNELEAYLSNPSPHSIEGKLMFLTKFVFSALIDADRTNTRMFEENVTAEPERNRERLFAEYYDKLMARIQALQERPDAQTAVNRLRREMSDQCDRFAEKPPGIYTLSIPTGGGKTLASLRYALKHVLKHRQRRIFYILPYTTIIEQNAEEVRKILQDDANILEHHSNVVDDLADGDEPEEGRATAQQKLKLAKDNWDSPVVFTTMVQFLDAFYAKGSRNIRRLHNLCDAVIIFDEVQKVPVNCVSLFNHALNFLKTYGRSSLILCTATQPALDFVRHKLEIGADGEMIGRLDQVIEAFKRVDIIDQTADGSIGTEPLADFVRARLEDSRSVLVILNTKSVVRKLYQQLQGGGVPLYHLSTSMCAAHRNDILDKVKAHLKNREPVICISTPLIEAGVDVSFDCVVRSLAGLDSIAQAAGRCNRHGEYGIRQVYVIDHAEEDLRHLKEIRVGKEAAKRMLVDLKRDPSLHGGSLLSKPAMDRYFQAFYSAMETSLDYQIPKLAKNMTDLLMVERSRNTYLRAYKDNHRSAPELCICNSYGTAAEYFRVIDSQAASVLVPYGDQGKELIARFSGEETIGELTRLLRKAQQYSVPVFAYEKDRLAQNGGLVSLLDGKILALKESAYHEEFGLDLENDSGFDFSMY